MRLFKRVAAVAALLIGVAMAGPGLAADYPAKPIKVIVSFAPGGGSDILMRQLSKVIEQEELLPTRLVIINMDGAGGSIGARQVKDAAPDGYTFLMSHFALLSAAATGVADFGVEAFEPVAQLVSSCLVWTVMEDAPYETLPDLMEAAKADPNTIREAINIGAVVHITSWITTDAAGGAKMRYVQSGGGAKRFESLIGDHVEAAQFSTAEYAAYKPKGLRGLALLAEERHPDLPDLPTAREQGIDAVACVSDTFFAPKGTPQEAIDVFAEALHKALESPDMQAFLEEDTRTPDYLAGAELREKLAADAQQIKQVVDRHRDELTTLRKN